MSTGYTGLNGKPYYYCSQCRLLFVGCTGCDLHP